MTRIILILLLGFLFQAGLLWPVISSASEQPLNQTPQDTGVIEPAGLMRGSVIYQEGTYIFGPGDILEIKVKDMPEFDQKVTLRPDGLASIHPFGEYRLGGTDIQGFEAWLEEKLKYYLLKPEATVSLYEIRPAMVYISGAVQRPGTYQFTRQSLSHEPKLENTILTLTNVLTRAGGVSEKADLRNIHIEHPITRDNTTFNLLAFLTEGRGKDIVLISGDKIHVPELALGMDPETFRLVSRSTYFKEKFPVIVLGAVIKQGEVLMDPTNNSLNAAIALAGGFLPTGSKRQKILIQRPNHSTKAFTEIIVRRKNKDFQLLPGDVVYIPDSNFAKFERTSRLLQSFGQGLFFSTQGANMVRKGIVNFRNLDGD